MHRLKLLTTTKTTSRSFHLPSSPSSSTSSSFTSFSRGVKSPKQNYLDERKENRMEDETMNEQEEINAVKEHFVWGDLGSSAERDKLNKRFLRFYPLIGAPNHLVNQFKQKKANPKVYTQFIHHFLLKNQPLEMNLWQNAYERDFNLQFNEQNHILFLLYNLREQNSKGTLYWFNRILLEEARPDELFENSKVILEIVNLILQNKAVHKILMDHVANLLNENIPLNPSIFISMVNHVEDSHSLELLIKSIIKYRIPLPNPSFNFLLRKIFPSCSQKTVYRWMIYMQSLRLFDHSSISILIQGLLMREEIGMVDLLKACCSIVSQEGGLSEEIMYKLSETVYRKDHTEVYLQYFQLLLLMKAVSSTEIFNKLLSEASNMNRHKLFVLWWNKADELSIPKDQSSWKMREEHSLKLVPSAKHRFDQDTLFPCHQINL